MKTRATKRRPAEGRVAATNGTFDMVLDMRNMSVDGCLAQLGGTLVKDGDRIRIDFPGYGQMPAQVAWRQGFQAGIAFDRELPETFVALFAEGQVMVEVDRSLPSLRWGSKKASLPPVESVLGPRARLV